MRKFVLTFESHFFALKAKRGLDDSYELSPTPRIVSSSCSSCLKKYYGESCDIIDIDAFKSLQGLEGIYIIDDDRKSVLYER